jgi:hypothetical protein
LSNLFLLAPIALFWLVSVAKQELVPQLFVLWFHFPLFPHIAP